jgi:hypothetical protein
MWFFDSSKLPTPSESTLSAKPPVINFAHSWNFFTLGQAQVKSLCDLGNTQRATECLGTPAEFPLRVLCTHD